MPSGLSVIICCYNSSSRIIPTLNHLLCQKNIDLRSVEVILVDNSSTDNTSFTANRHWESYSDDKPAFRIVQEPTPGLSVARKKGIEVANFNFIVFCDDDNWLDENYLSWSMEIMASNPQIGALGGMGIPVFEDKEPPYFWINQFHVLAVGPQWHREGDISNSRQVLYGAGMILNKVAFSNLERDYNFRFLLSGRIQTGLSSSEDHELCLALKMSGYQIVYSSKLQFKHFIPKNRTTINYYKRLFYGFGVSFAQLQVYRVRKDELYYIKNDYRYICCRCLKNILKSYILLLIKGYHCSSNKYKYIDYLHQLYSNRGIFSTSLKLKNVFREQHRKFPIFRLKM